MGRPLWFVALLKRSFASRFLLARLTNAPVVGRIVDHWLFEGDDILYLPQNQVIPVGEAVDLPGEMAVPSRVVEHFVQEANCHWLMDTCICRDAAGCEDYPVDLGCLFLGEAAVGIHPQLGRRVTREEALDHLQRCREAGLVHMVGRNKLDTVWLGVGPGHKLLTICNCCPCCCLWRMLPHLTPRIGAKVARLPGLTVTVTDRCLGCGTCTQGVCFVDAIHLDGQGALISDACRGCGRCIDVCPQGAIEISIGDEHFVARAIQRLASSVDVS
jgi:NAD-dependent dihydropyrimidine dehydrogenase PreA subunit